MCIRFPSGRVRALRLVFRSAGRLFFERRRILLPFRWEEIFFFTVTVFTSRDEVSLHGLAAAHDRYEMVHGQFRRLERLAAIGASSARPFPLPPLRGPELARFTLLALDMLFVRCIEKGVGHSKIDGRMQNTENRLRYMIGADPHFSLVSEPEPLFSSSPYYLFHHPLSRPKTGFLRPAYPPRNLL